MDESNAILRLIENVLLRVEGKCRYDLEGRAWLKNEILQKVQEGRPLSFFLAGYPFKSPQPSKVAGKLPDGSEEISLSMIHRLITGIKQIYDYTSITILSDGRTYNDLMNVSDIDVQNYGSELRLLSHERGYDDVIKWANLNDVMDLQMDYEYGKVRQYLVQNFGKGINLIRDVILNPNCDPNKKLVFISYVDVARNEIGLRDNLEIQEFALLMVQRHDALNNALAKYCRDFIRFSIHPTDNYQKYSISLTGQSNWTNPWHGVVYFDQFNHPKIIEKIEAEKLENTVIVMKSEAVENWNSHHRQDCIYYYRHHDAKIVEFKKQT